MAASNSSVVFTCFARSMPRSDMPSRRRSFRVERPQSASHVGRLATRTVQRSGRVFELREGSSTQVIMFTGKDDPLVRSTSLKAGASAFFTKPFDDEEFLTAVRFALSAM